MTYLCGDVEIVVMSVEERKGRLSIGIGQEIVDEDGTDSKYTHIVDGNRCLREDAMVELMSRRVEKPLYHGEDKAGKYLLLDVPNPDDNMAFLAVEVDKDAAQVLALCCITHEEKELLRRYENRGHSDNRT